MSLDWEHLKAVPRNQLDIPSVMDEQASALTNSLDSDTMDKVLPLHLAVVACPYSRTHIHFHNKFYNEHMMSVLTYG